MPNLRGLSISILLLALAAPAMAQTHPVAPPPQPPDAAPASSGPSLEVTLQFIADKINENGTINYVAFGQSTTDGSTFSKKFSKTFSQARPDAAQCTVSYHFKEIIDGQKMSDLDAGVPLREVQDVVVMPLEQAITQSWAAGGHPEMVVISVSPPFTVVKVRRLHGGDSNIEFADASFADRVAKAITHAVELCGGGEKPEPF
jgi:hypothetical protein